MLDRVLLATFPGMDVHQTQKVSLATDRWSGRGFSYLQTPGIVNSSLESDIY